MESTAYAVSVNLLLMASSWEQIKEAADVASVALGPKKLASWSAEQLRDVAMASHLGLPEIWKSLKSQTLQFLFQRRTRGGFVSLNIYIKPRGWGWGRVREELSIDLIFHFFFLITLQYIDFFFLKYWYEYYNGTTLN